MVKSNNPQKATKSMVAVKICLLLQCCIILCPLGRLNMMKVFFMARRFQGRKNKLFVVIAGCRDEKSMTVLKLALSLYA